MAYIHIPRRVTRTPRWPFALNRDSEQAQGLIAAYVMTSPEGGVRDITGNQARPSLVSTTWKPSVQTNSLALDFNGSSGYVNAGAFNEHVTPGAISTLSHFRADAGDSMVVARFDGTTSNHDLQIPYIFSGSGSVNIRARAVTTDATLTSDCVLGGESFYFCGYDESAISIRNLKTGASASSSQAGTLDSNSEPWLIGVDPDATGGGSLGNWFTGAIYRVFFYDHIVPLATQLAFYNPATRWDAIYELGRRAYFVPAAAAAAAALLRPPLAPYRHNLMR